MSLSTGHEKVANPVDAADPADLVTLTIDGIEVQAPKGSLLIRVAEELGIAIPRFCDHPLLEPAGACRQCLVEVAMPDREGNVRPMPKPQASCTMTVAPGMVVQTQATSAVADKAQHGIMEMLLVNHPLDCPICDKGGECPLQNQAMSNGRGTSRFVDVKRTFPKPIKISTQVLLDRERCILCQRCTRFSKEIAGDTFIDLQKRGAKQQIGTFDTQVLDFAGAPLTEGAAELDEAGAPFASYFSGNTIQICPVGRAHRRGLPVPGPAVRPRVLGDGVRALRVRLRGARRPPPRRRAAPPGRRGPRGQRGVELRQGPLGVHLPDAARPAPGPDGPRRDDGRARRDLVAGRARRRRPRPRRRA